jgi:cytochrome c oxidase subunit II
MTLLHMAEPALAEWLPEASSVAPRFDRIFDQLLAVSAVTAVLLGTITVVILIRYRRGSPAARGPLGWTTWRIEASWITATLAVFLYFYVEGAGAYSAMEGIPPGIREIDVVGRQWMWDVTYPDGRRDFNEVHVRLNAPVRIVLSSEDVIHSFFVPAFRIKQDLVPGRVVSTWFTPTRAGTFPLYCAQYCGTAHAQMTGAVVVLDDSDFEAWSRSGSRALPLAARGQAAYARYGCAGCHASGSSRAPPLAGLYGAAVVLADGSRTNADDAYLANAILSAPSYRVAGYSPDMPSYGKVMSRDEALGLVAYIKEIGSGTGNRGPQK